MTNQPNKPAGQPTPQKNAIESFGRERLASDITNIHKALVVDMEVKKIPESTFVKEILPILTGEVVSPDFPVLMASVAGTPFSEVDVVDADGNIVFRMPALLERDIFSHEEASKRGSMHSMFITMEMLSQQSPARARNYLQYEFDGRGIATNIAEIINRRNQRWNTILARYGKSLTPDGAVKDDAAADVLEKERPQLNLNDGELL